VLERRAREADCRGSHLRPGMLEEVHRDQETLSLLAEQPVGRNTGAVEHDRAGVRGAQADLVLDATGEDAGVAGLEEEGGHGTVELREHDRQLGDAAVRDSTSPRRGRTSSPSRRAVA
jgi:hypothetical protein